MAKNLASMSWWKAAGIRALKTVGQTLAGQIPAGFIITPIMIENANWSYFNVILAWLCTGVVAGIASLCTSLAGLPEVNEE